MAFNNLKAEMIRHGITQEEIANNLGMSRCNFNLKINEKVPTTIVEATEIKSHFFPELSMDYLFASDGRAAGVRESAHAQVDLIEDALRRDGLLDEEAREVVAGLHEGVEGMAV